MSADHPFLRWALRYVLDRVPEDRDAPVFGTAHGVATSLTDAERELVNAYPDEPADAESLREQLATLMDPLVKCRLDWSRPLNRARMAHYDVTAVPGVMQLDPSVE